MPNCLIIGGGVIGLSLASELARRAWHVRVIDRQRLASEASWAGAGILPPANADTAIHPIDKLRALSHQLHQSWAKRLLAATGIDNGLRRCGGIYLATSAGEAASLAAMAQSLREEQIACIRLSSDALSNLEPAIARRDSIRAAYRLPDEYQLRNPRHLQALLQECRQLGVTLDEHCEATEIAITGDKIQSVTTSHGKLQADAYVVTGGAWTHKILQQIGVSTAILPMRGQIVLFRCDRPPVTHILNEGPRYIVPRDDGHVLVGSTEEEVGFDKSNTDEGIRDLTEFAYNLLPSLREATIERTWAGLRPATFDGFPYIGRAPGLGNLYVAAGHFRSGLHLSPGTAVLLAQMLCGETPELDLTPFRVSRG